MERGNRSLIAALLVGVLLGVSSSGLAWLLSAREQFEPPTVGLTFDSEKFQVLVSRADDPPRPLLNFRADVSLNGTPYASLPRLDRPGDNILGFLDADMDGRLSVDDFFYLLVVRIEPHELVLSWKNIRVGSVSWQVIVPTVTFSPDHGQPQTMVITVSSASPVTPIADWSAAVSGNGYYRGSLDPLREETVQLSQRWISHLRRREWRWRFVGR